MKNYDEQFQVLREKGMFYDDVKKDFCGKVDKATFFNVPGMIINTFGYYQNEDETWSTFVTDDERGVNLYRNKVPTEEEAIESLIKLVEISNFAYYFDSVTDHLEEKQPTIIEHLKAEYGYSEAQAEKAMEYLLQSKAITFEYYYYIENGDFLPDGHASVFSGYTARRLYEETYLTVLGAFNYMIYLKKNPAEALENLKRGLPRK